MSARKLPETATEKPRSRRGAAGKQDGRAPASDQPAVPPRNVEIVMELIDDWTRRPSPPLEQVETWLHGTGLPDRWPDYEPYWWLLRGTRLSRIHDRVATRLAEGLARVLDRLPDRVLEAGPGFTFNALRLAEGLRRGEVLMLPLDRLVRARIVKGDYHAGGLQKALVDAMRTNQRDTRWLPIWRALLRGKTRFGIKASVDDGLNGILYMPGSAKHPGEPPLTPVGEALKLRMGYLLAHEDEMDLARSLLRRVESIYAGRPSLREELIRMADRSEWTRWQVLTLPDLCVRRRVGHDRFLLWREIAESIPERDYEVLDSGLCGREVWDVRVRNPIHLQVVADVLEAGRLSLCSPRERAICGQISLILDGACRRPEIAKHPQVLARLKERSRKTSLGVFDQPLDLVAG